MNAERAINLRIPGPTALPPAVREALGRQMINHRGPEYAAMQQEVLEHLRHFFQTEQDVLLFGGSGTGGLEAAVVNTLSPGDSVLAVSIGAFGDRFAAIAEAYGAQVYRLEVPWGAAADPHLLEHVLDADGQAFTSPKPEWLRYELRAPTPLLDRPRPFKAVLITCNETSTGVMNDLAAVAPIVHASSTSPLLLVDAISALGAVDLPMDALGIDVLITGSQKAWMAPPGITMLGVSERAWRAHEAAGMPRFHWDFTRQRKAQAKGQDAWTPPVTTMFGLHAALRMMREEGREAIVARHAHIAARTQHGLEALGFRLFAEAGHRSRSVTAAEPPPGVEAGALISYAREHHGVVLAGGQERLAGKIIRVGHMGWVEEEHIADTLGALEAALAAPGAGRPVPA